MGANFEVYFKYMLNIFLLDAIFILFITLLMYFYMHDFQSSISENMILQQKQRVLENLHEAIVCKSKDGISYCNDQGFSIIQNICKILHYQGEAEGISLDNLPMNLRKNRFVEGNFTVKSIS